MILKFKKRKNRGMTIPEVLIAFAIGVLLIGIVLSMWYFAYRSWAIDRIRTRLRIDLEIAIERIKKEVRLSSFEYMSYYPSDATEYAAISFPVATPDSTDDDFFELSAVDGSIVWEKSIIYHVAGTELLRTENTFLSDSGARDTQLADVVSGGKTEDSKVICENLSDFTIKPKFLLFDGYSSSIKRTKVEFGSVKLDPTYSSGYHDFKFEVVGTSGTGYKFGIDSLFITPSGCEREAEFYHPLSSPHSHSGDSSSKEYMSGWSGNYYLKYSAGGEEDYVNLYLYDDLWRESNFDNSIRDNTSLTGNDLYVQLASPSVGGEVCWEATAQTGSAPADCPASLTDIAIRNVLKGTTGSDYIDVDPNEKLIRVKFVAHSTNAITISAAWIAERSTTNPEDGTGTPAQLFFSGSSSVTILAGDEVWSEWTTFTITEGKDYLVTFYTPSANVSYWAGSVGQTNSYYANDANNDTLSDINDASANDWINFTASPHIYAVGLAENWANQGTVTSAIYDTKVDSTTSPAYGNISWGYNTPSGTSVSVEVRASDNEDMSGATTWASVTNGGSLPSGIDGKRYVQFRATLTSASPYTAYPWIDNVTIDWPGAARMCEITGYFAQDSDYGKIKLTVDGQELTKGLEFDITISKDFRGETYETSLTTEIEPRNTGY